MKFERFLERLRVDIERFEKMYRDGHRTAPASFPMVLEEGEWNEQFLVSLREDE